MTSRAPGESPRDPRLLLRRGPERPGVAFCGRSIASFGASTTASVTSSRRVLALAIPFGAALGFLPAATRLALPRVVPHLAGAGATLLVAAFLGALGFGAFLTTLAITGLEQQQAFSVLGHPGFKHFARLCVPPDGRIEAWTIGKEDTLGDGPPELIDSFAWNGDDVRR